MALAITGCVTAGQESYTADEEDRFNVSVRVENDQWFEMRIFVEGGIGAQKFLGNVQPRSASAFMLPAHLVNSGAELRLLADPIGSTQQMLSDPLDIGDGHNIQWKLRKSGGDRLIIM